MKSMIIFHKSEKWSISKNKSARIPRCKVVTHIHTDVWNCVAISPALPTSKPREIMMKFMK